MHVQSPWGRQRAQPTGQSWSRKKPGAGEAEKAARWEGLVGCKEDLFVLFWDRLYTALAVLELAT